MGELSSWLSVLGGVAAFLTALAALAQARSTKDAFEATIYLDFTKRYNTEEMADAIRTLVHWYKQDERDFNIRWRDDLRRNDATAVEINRARRLVSRYFFDIGGLYEANLISYNLARILTANVGLDVFFSICEPLNDALDPSRNHKFSNALKRIRSSYSEGIDYR